MARVLEVLALGPGPAAARPPSLDPADLALLRGEGVFETLRVYGGRPFRLGEHLARLAASAAAVQVRLDGLDLERLALDAARAAGGRDAVLRLVCTKGVEDGGATAAYALLAELPDELEEQRARGLAVVLLPLAVDPLVRASSPWLLPGVKSTSYAVNMAAQRAAQARGADDALFTGLGGELLESPTANVWWRAGRVLFTPSLDVGILAGVTRTALLRLAPGLGYRVVEGVFTAEDLAAADEAFLSSSVREVMPVVAVGRDAAAAPAPVGDGRPGAAAAALQAALHAEARGGPAGSDRP
ncbi:MAG TPA: aminotransferase class IV [Actinomycetes bacterium]|nr:aminotransferase class IV [Actinomycetes bacterium]